LAGKTIEWYDQAAVCVVMAAEGYPGEIAKGDVINGLDAADALQDVTVFHAGTAEQDGKVVTAGGRVLGVTARGTTVAAAIERAYQGVAAITWRGVQFRRDIGRKALDRR